MLSLKNIITCYLNIILISLNIIQNLNDYFYSFYMKFKQTFYLQNIEF